MSFYLKIFLLLSITLLHNIQNAQSDCCYPIKFPFFCDNPKGKAYLCADCSEPTYPHIIFATRNCGKGQCNIFGCNCDGGCRPPKLDPDLTTTPKYNNL